MREGKMLTNQSIPRCTVIPELVYPDIGKAIDWLCDAFGFTLRLRIADHRAQLNVGDGAVVLMEPREDGSQPGQANRWHSTMVRVENVDRHCEHARQRGARILRPPTDYPFGERQYSVEDFTGHQWTFSQSIADIDPRSWGGVTGAL
jgi:uncharacterized glyoxalase superfamily protein PhnB